MTEMFSFKAILAAITSTWRRGSIFLWSLAAACFVALIVLAAGAYWQVGDMPTWFAASHAWLLLAIPVLCVFASFKTYSERPAPTLSLLPRERESFCVHARQKDGAIATQLGLRFQAANLTDGAIMLSAIKLRRPLVCRRAISKTMIPRLIERRSLTVELADIRIAHPVDRVGKTLRVVVFVQDHAGRWHKFIFPHLPVRSSAT